MLTDGTVGQVRVVRERVAWWGQHMERGTSAVERIHGEQYQIKEKTIKENKTWEKSWALCTICMCLPQIPFVGGVLNVVTNVVVHSMGCCAVSGIKNLKSKYKNKKSEVLWVLHNRKTSKCWQRCIHLYNCLH